MPQSRFAGTSFVAVALAGMLAAGCAREADETPPVAQGQSERQMDGLARPVTVLGCLRAGEAANTYVVTSSEAEQEGRTRTYALNYPDGGVPEELRDHVGREVQVEGVVRTHTAVTGATPATPPANEPVGTGGQPRVQTSTALAIEQLDVTALRPSGEACADR